MVLAADDMGDAHVDIVDAARQHVEPAAVLAADHRIGEQGRVEMLAAADQIVPLDRPAVIEPEAPVRPAPLRLEPGAVTLVQLQRGAIVDRRLAAAELDLALEVELLRALISWIDASRLPQPLESGLVPTEARRLAMLLVRSEAEPAEVVAYSLGMRLARPLAVGVVEPKDEA